MESVSQKSVVRKGFKNMIVLGLGLAVTVGFAPTTSWASFQNSAVQTCRFNGQYQDSQQVVYADNGIIMARGGSRSGGGRGMGQRESCNSERKRSERGYKYGPGDGTGTKERPADGTGYGAKKGTGTGESDGTIFNGKDRGNRINQENLDILQKP